MGYQALLFCPDEKIARTVTQVLSELEFAVEPCIEPFAAVKKLMAEHFDAVVVDCDNDQNASLLFKSARNSSINQASLAVAVVEGQAGVAKAFRIGANLVLTKPINVEQAKGTLRVARGLLRKGEGVKPATPGSAPAPAATPAPAPAPAAPVKTARPVPAAPARPATLAAASAKARAAAPPVAKPAAATSPRPQDHAALPASASSAASPSASAAKPSAVKAAPASTQTTHAAVVADTAAPASAASPASAGGAASATAPARVTAPTVVEAPAPTTSKPAEPEKISSATDATESKPQESAAPSLSPSPSFTFGGANLPEKSESGGSKKVFLAIAAVVLLACAGYFGWTQLQGNTNSHSAAPNPASPASAKVAVPAPGETQPSAAPSTSSASAAPSTATQSSAPDIVLSTNDAASSDSANNDPAANSKPSASAATKPAPSSKPAAPAAPPIVLKNGAMHSSAKPASVDAAAPSMDSMASAGGSDGSLSDLTATDSAAKPVLQTLNVSQGVSQGLLLKKIQPSYPPTALRMRTEGAVKLMATIGKTGSVTEVKVLSGEPLLTQSAVEAVKQWKYKPYLLNGDPVEIQTEVTINFKLPN